MRHLAALLAVCTSALLAAAGCSMGHTSVSPPIGAGVSAAMTHPDYRLTAAPDAPAVPFIAGPAGGSSHVSPEFRCGTGSLLYAAQYYTDAIQVYVQSGSGQKPCATIVAKLVNPQGLTSDGSGDLWVANTGANNVLEFKRGALRPARTLSDAGEFPADVCIDSNGNIFATNLLTTGGGPGSVSEWIKGVGPPKTLEIPNNTRVLYCALDNRHDLFVNYINSAGTGSMDEFVAGKNKPVVTKVATQFPGGLDFDAAQDLVGNDQLGPTTCVYELPDPTGTCVTATGRPLGLAITSAGKNVYVSDASGGSVYEYSYPSFTLKDTISDGLGAASPPFGLAADPARPL
jgi:DNA-binding beta-propeller fold protein YncE